MKISALSNEELLTTLKNLAHQEREITLRVLHHLREVDRRCLHAKLGFSSLFDYATIELKYSAGAAQRRISSMRLLRDIPDIEDKIKDGSLSLSTLSQAQSFFRQERVPPESKKEVLQALENKSRREVEKELIARSRDPIKLIPEQVRFVTENYMELKVILSTDVWAQIEELKNLLAHRHPHSTVMEILEFAIKKALESLRVKAPKSPPTGSLPPAEVKRPPIPASSSSSRYVSREVRRQIWSRDQAQCTFISANGRRCSCKRGLEMDHILPFAMGGTNSLDNLRLRCRTHNQLAAVEAYGKNKVSNFIARFH